MSGGLDTLQAAIGYTFKDTGLLRHALVHSSATAVRLKSNERMEFLGDRVLGLVLSRCCGRSALGRRRRPAGRRHRRRCRARARRTPAGPGRRGRDALGPVAAALPVLPLALGAAVHRGPAAAAHQLAGLLPARCACARHSEKPLWLEVEPQFG